MLVIQFGQASREKLLDQTGKIKKSFEYGGDPMSGNAKRAIVWLIFAVGIVLLIVGATTPAYSTMTGVIIFLCLLVVSIALRILWGLGRRKGE